MLSQGFGLALFDLSTLLNELSDNLLLRVGEIAAHRGGVLTGLVGKLIFQTLLI